MSHTPTQSDAEVDKHLDAVLRAAGSALRHYTMQKSLDDMRAAMRAAMAGDEPGQAETIEALRRGLCALPRCSFHLDQGGGVRRVDDRYGRWIEWQQAHELFDIVVVNALVGKLRAAAAIAKAQGGKG